jgi:aspartyl/asparaginyl-tRNA synthetase
LHVDISPEAIHPKNQERMTYADALKFVQSKGSGTVFGKGLTASDETLLTSHIGQKYLWVMFNPAEAEGFPYRRHDTDPRLVMTCDLIAPHGSGEMVGIAEKITDTTELIEKMLEKGLGSMVLNYRDYLALRSYGLPAHGGIGAAPERIVYGLLGLDHIMYTKSHPRYPDRKIATTGSLNPWKNEQLKKLFNQYGITEK